MIEKLPIILTTVAATIAIFSFFYKILGNLRLIKIHKDTNHPVSKTELNYLDIKNGLTKIIDDAKKFNPDYIFGINRGGVIVGGIIAKQLSMSQVYILYVNLDNPTDKIITEHKKDKNNVSGKKILLVDDSFRSGDHMNAATKYLKEKYSRIELRRTVLLEIIAKNVGPEKNRKSYTPVESKGFYTYDGRVVLPWDK